MVYESKVPFGLYRGRLGQSKNALWMKKSQLLLQIIVEAKVSSMNLSVLWAISGVE